MSHAPVMLDEVMEALKPAAHEVYVDGTFGAGGYTQTFLDKADCTVIAIDRDPAAIERANSMKEKYGERLVFIHGCFGDADKLLEKNSLGKVDGFVLDLGVSSMQLDEAQRGFSFRFDAPLDMRMGDTEDTPTAADIVNTYDVKDLTAIIREYGEERHAGRVARKIVEARAEAPITTTGQLASIVRSAVPKSPRDPIDQATRTFQALRIAVNDELGQLEQALKAAKHILKPGGRFIVVSFHSLEDSRVKAYFREHGGEAPRGSRHMPEITKDGPAPFRLLYRKAIKPGEAETKRNPRARSARLRAVIRTEAAA